MSLLHGTCTDLRFYIKVLFLLTFPGNLVEVVGQDVRKLLLVLVLLLLGAGHDGELHRADLLGEDAALLGGLVELVKDDGSDGA